MKFSRISTAVALATGACASKKLTPERVVADITGEDLQDVLHSLNKIALDNGSNRGFGMPGYNASLDFVLSRLSCSNKFDITVQPFTHLFSHTRHISLTGPDGEDVQTISLQYNNPTPQPDGVTAPLFLVPVDDTNGTGCQEEQWEGLDVKGKIALIKRGKCHFADPLAFAKSKGAVAAIIFNNNPTQLAGSGSLGAENFGNLAPVGVITYDQGTAWMKRIEEGETLEVNLNVDMLTEDRETWQIIADTKQGDPNNIVMLGAHLDSIQEGPGINDNGSGVSALLAIAESFKKYKGFKNKVRFAFWGAEESGMIGSLYYLKNLSQKEISKIRFYFNYDMIASPKPRYVVYTNSDADKAGAKYLFDYLEEQGYPAEYQPFGSGSDYIGFIEAGIPSSGIFTGAGAPYDACYHTSCDDIDNINKEALVVNAKAAGFAAANLALSVDDVPKHATTSTNPKSKRGMARNIARWANLARGAEKVHSCGSGNVLL
ncbi:hypothetical protein FDECE_10547 [Fusarium decemcellulare]|nr:hypothetical protein FDECE_10547 [Fusarium decemcellulare]